MPEVQIIKRSKKRLTLQVTVDLAGDSFLEVEDKILEACNAIGCKATEEALTSCDTDGSPIIVNERKQTARGQNNKEYQTPYGPVSVTRFVYQTSKGGKIYCPLEESAHIIQGSTPRFAKMLAHKYASLHARATCSDMQANHGRQVSLSFLQNVADSVSAIAQANEEKWSYEIPKLEEEVRTVSMSLDGAMLNIRDDGWREAMVGSISLYDRQGERLHSLYFGAAPEHGKAEFKKRFAREAERIRAHYPDADFIGIADGASDNWTLLEQYTDHKILDFYHASEYLAKASEAACTRKSGKPERTRWLEENCHTLKHDDNGASAVLEELDKLNRKYKLSQTVKEYVSDAIRYFRNHLPMMNYTEYRKRQWPIGSGVTEAACKTLIKQRFCGSGMRWKESGVKTVLSLRSLVLTTERWDQFWEKIISEKIGAVPAA